MQAASRADGAGESGLTQLLWVNALHMAGDAMIAVSLAGTLFFAATTDAQRGNVALYLLVTMAPFAVLAPVIGPAAGPAAARPAVGARGQPRSAARCWRWSWRRTSTTCWLYPAALGVLVLSKAHNVLRAAVVPRVLPPAHVADLGERPAVGLRAGDRRGRRRDRRRRSRGRSGFPPGSCALTAAVFAVAGVLAMRLPPPRRRPDRASCPPTC